MGFRKDFAWGVASSSYQNEGSVTADGKGLSVWDVFTHEEGKVADKSNGDVASDQYRLWEKDVALLEELAVNSDRFSISWPRVLPEGIGRVNEKGLDYYDRLVDALLSKGITPYITLFHWDMPYELYLKGGWLNRDMPRYFAEYAEVVIRRLSDRVQHWITQNEPQCYISSSLENGEHAPGLRLGKKDLFLAAHHSLLSHGYGAQAIKAAAKTRPVIGYAPASWWLWSPLTENKEDVEACRNKTFAALENPLGGTGFWLDPVLLGRYPLDFLQTWEPYLPRISQEDMKVISEPIDFVGMNVYQTYVGRAGGEGTCENVSHRKGYAKTMASWPVTPKALYWGPKFYWERYHKPIVITENGMSNEDWIHLDGRVHDPQRIDFTHRYLSSLKRAAEEGVDIRGYFHWTFTDNFEWSRGYDERFGMVYVDFETRERVIKDSGFWYRDVILSNGECL